MSEMVEALIDSIRVSLMSPQRVVILRQKDTERYLPIWVGPYEAESITVALQEVETARPMTHDLFKNVLKVFDATLVRVEISALKDDIFYGNLVLTRDGQTFNVDSRPSDAIALAVRAHAPILVHQQVMDEAGISPEKDLREEPPAAEQAPPAEEQVSGSAPMDEGRLDVFEDFLKKLGGESDEDKPKEDKPKE
jgi:bifunctional DNase/RNase